MSQFKKPLSSLSIIFLSLMFCSLVNCQTSTIPNQLVSIEFNQMINAAMKQVTSSKSFINYIANSVAFSVPTCASNPSWPNKNPIPSSVKELKVCYDSVTLDTLWIGIYRRVGIDLVAAINSKYGTSYANRFVYVNTTNGYFESMRNAVETEECDVSVADTTFTAERMSKVQFADCGYGSTANGFLRTLLDKENNSTFSNLKDISQLNSPNITVAVYYGTYYETLANQTLPLAKKILTSFDEQFELIKNNKVHVVISDSEALQSWKVVNCPGCIAMTLQGLEKVTIEDPASFTWRVKVKCPNCQTEHGKHIFLCENEKEDKNVKAGTSATNLNFSCSVCKRHATIDVISGTFKEISQSEKFFPLVQFDCRGVDIVKWEPEGSEGLVAFNSDGTKFEVNLENMEYFDYDEESEQEISITNIKVKFGK